MPEHLDDETRRLVESASRYIADPDRIEMEESAQAPLDLTGYVIESICSVCGYGPVQVHWRFRLAARCSPCILAGHEPRGQVLPDDRVPTLTLEMLREPWMVPAPVEPEKHPQPAVEAMECVAEGLGVPKPVQALLSESEALGWGSFVSYARGHGVHGVTGAPTKLVETFSVKLSKGEERVTAVYTVGGGWGSMWALKRFMHLRTREQLGAYLAGVDDEWIIRTRAANVEHERRKPCTSPEIHEAHTWHTQTREPRYCNGRTAVKTKKTKESGG